MTPEAPKRLANFTPSPSSIVVQFSPEQATHLLSTSIRIDSSYMNQHFITLSKLGEGDFGEVKEVKSKHSSSKFAIKIFKVDKKKVKSGLNHTKDNLDEIHAHMSLPSHPNLIQFYQAWKEDGYLYLQMELSQYSLDGYWRMKNQLTHKGSWALVLGAPISAAMSQKCLKLYYSPDFPENKDIRDVTTDCLLALKHLASFNIAHLDIKPQNILRSEGGVFKLADFSVTVDLNKKDSSSGEFGTGRYAAPELLNGNFSTKADFYSLGISLSQVSVPSDAPLTKDEWNEMKEDGKLPSRVSEALTGSFGIVEMVQSMISEYSSRPSANDLLPESHREFALEECKNENNNLRESMKNMHFRLSHSSSCERQLRENKSPLVKSSENSGVIFHTDPKFFEMGRPLRQRASMGSKRPLRFKLEEN